jgi:hypothetical protein
MQFLHVMSTVYLGTLAKYHQPQSGYLADSTANVESVALNHASLFPAIPVFRLLHAVINQLSGFKWETPPGTVTACQQKIN